MKKISFIIFLISLSSATLAMELSTPTLKDILRLQGVSKQEILQLHGVKKEIIERIQDKDSAILQITSLLPKEDIADMRLVCKEWAPKDLNWKDKPHWTFMPDDVEEEHNNIMKKKCKIDGIDQTVLLFHFTIKNNFEAVQWITHNTHTLQGMRHNTRQWFIDSCMIAIHNKNHEIARFLIETDSRYANNNWKFHYNNITIPEIFQNYLYPHDNRNFSFLFYLIAVLTDNAHDLEKLYLQKIPTYEGREFLIKEAKRHNATECLKILSKTEEELKKLLQEKENNANAGHDKSSDCVIQ